MDIAIDPATGDLLLDEAGDAVIVTGRAAIAQHIRVRFQHFLGEWHLDRREGVPWFEQILVANPDLTIINELFRRTVRSTPGIASVRSLSLDFDRATRTLVVRDFEAVTTNGEGITADDFAVPFVLVSS
jgi:hypothetical protein